MAEFENWGDYFWPGQIDDCRKNLLGIHDAEQLETAERRLTAVRAAELASGEAPIEKTWDLDHLKAIHRHLFQDVYEWAGEVRVTELVRPSTDPNAPGNEFVKPEDIERLAPMVFAQLGDPSELRGRPTPEVVDVLTPTLNGTNVLHPFVEGNGRAQRAFLDQAAEAAGHRIVWSRIADRQNAMMAEGFGVGPEPVRLGLTDCVEPIGLDNQAASAAWAARGGVLQPDRVPDTGSSAQAAGKSGRQHGRSGPQQESERPGRD